MGRRDSSRTGANTEPMPFIRKFGSDNADGDESNSGASEM